MNVPKLRFGEFADEWDIKLINDITSKVGSGSTPSGGSQVYTDKGILFIRSQNINNDQLIFDDTTYISQSIHDKMKGSTVQANDVLLNITGASIGRSCVVPENFIVGNVNQHVSIIRFIDGYVPRFYQKYLSSERGQKHISSLQVGSGREGLNFQAIRKIAIPSPDMNEQQKIADFLSAVDDKITALTAQKSALTQYKQGMMQRIFSQTLRFKDDNGADYPDWEETLLETVVIVQGGYAFKSERFSNLHRNKVIRIGDIDKNINLKQFSGVYTSEQPAEKFIVKLNDFLMALSGATFGKIGKVVDDDIAYINQRVATFRTQECKPFIYQLFLTENFTNYIQSIPSSSAQPNISPSDIGKFLFMLPGKREQTQIAQFLTELDDKFNAVDAQIQSAKQWKQGLLQQLFV